MSEAEYEITREALLAEYRRLSRIEDAAKALLVGRLRDTPDEKMAGLWGDLIKVLDAPMAEGLRRES